jgi:putative endonuclease
MDTTALGRQAETRAWQYLRERGLRLRERNYRSRRGELDLVVEDGDSLVFVEVRYRSHPGYGSGAESVDRRKQARLIACAQHYMQRHPQLARRPCRFDVISVGAAGGAVEWIRDAFGTGG